MKKIQTIPSPKLEQNIEEKFDELDEILFRMLQNNIDMKEYLANTLDKNSEEYLQSLSEIEEDKKQLENLKKNL